MKSTLLLLGQVLFANFGGMLLLGGLLDMVDEARWKPVLASIPFLILALLFHLLRQQLLRKRKGLFGPDDSLRYQRTPKKSLSAEVWSAFLGVPCVTWIAWKVDIAYLPGFAIVSGLASVGLLSFLTIRYVLYPRLIAQGIADELLAGLVGEFHLFVLPYGLFWSNVLLFQGLASMLRDAAFLNLSHDPHIREMIPFVAGIFFNTVLFDLPDLIGFRFSPIEAIRATAVSAPLFLYKVCTGAGLLLVLLSSYRVLVKHRGKMLHQL
jgi:hypothetical protein